MFRVRVGLVFLVCVSGFAADLGAGVSGSARCALEAAKARRSRRLLLSTGVICVLMLRVRWV